MQSTKSTPAPSLIDLPSRFQAKDLIGSKVTRLRKFTPIIFFRTMLELVGGTNKEGYAHALANVFFAENEESFPPVKSALCKIRNRVNYSFFEDLLFELLSKFEPKRYQWNGLRVYAMDGNELEINCSPDILEAGYRGRAVRKTLETHYPHLYTVHAFDVLSSVTKGLYFSARQNELEGMQNLVPKLEKNSLCIYDRFYMSKSLLQVHKGCENFFLARVKRNSYLEARKFLASNKKRELVEIHNVQITFLKIKNIKGEGNILLATNLPKNLIHRKSIYRLYAHRWEVENSFKDLACTIRLNQWHSFTVNGVLQELFMAYWLMNYTRIQVAIHSAKPRNPLSLKYEKPNFKILVSWIKKKIVSQLEFIDFTKFIWLMNYTREKREKFIRSYPRKVRISGKKYNCDSLVLRREVA